MRLFFRVRQELKVESGWKTFQQERNPPGGIQDDGDGTGRHARNNRKAILNAESVEKSQ